MRQAVGKGNDSVSVCHAAWLLLVIKGIRAVLPGDLPRVMTYISGEGIKGNRGEET